MVATRRERRQAILRTRRNASVRLNTRRLEEYRVRRNLGEITGEQWTVLVEAERKRHRSLVLDIEDEWDRWPRAFAYPFIGVVIFAFWAGIFWLYSRLHD